MTQNNKMTDDTDITDGKHNRMTQNNKMTDDTDITDVEHNRMTQNNKMTDDTDITDGKNNAPFIYKELSFKLIGLAYEVFNSLGHDLKEERYKRAYAILLDKEKIGYVKEQHYPLKIRNEIFTRRYFDFLIEDKIIVEFKTGNKTYLNTYRQLLEYLKISNIKLGLIIRFTPKGVKVKRIPNLY